MTPLITRSPMTEPVAPSPQPANVRLAGIVTFHDDTKGFGMIHAEGTEYFFHAKVCHGVEGGNTFRTLVLGTLVTFEPREHDKGLRAFAVRVDKDATAKAEDARGNR